MAIKVKRASPAWRPMTDDAQNTVIEALRDLECRLYRLLEREYERLTSDAAVGEAIAANGWMFTQAGRRPGRLGDATRADLLWKDACEAAEATALFVQRYGCVMRR